MLLDKLMTEKLVANKLMINKLMINKLMINKPMTNKLVTAYKHLRVIVYFSYLKILDKTSFDIGDGDLPIIYDDALAF